MFLRNGGVCGINLVESAQILSINLPHADKLVVVLNDDDQPPTIDIGCSECDRKFCTFNLGYNAKKITYRFRELMIAATHSHFASEHHNEVKITSDFVKKMTNLGYVAMMTDETIMEREDKLSEFHKAVKSNLPEGCYFYEKGHESRFWVKSPFVDIDIRDIVSAIGVSLQDEMFYTVMIPLVGLWGEGRINYLYKIMNLDHDKLAERVGFFKLKQA